MPENADALRNRKPGEIITIYPHSGVALVQIAKAWIITGVFIGLILFGIHLAHPEPQIEYFVRWGCVILGLGAIGYAGHRLLHYANTYVQIDDDALIYREGWIPHKSDTIFWINIKDINTSASVTESMMGAGSIMIVIAIRNAMGAVIIPYLPDHEKIAEYIREKIGAFNAQAHPISYT